MLISSVSAYFFDYFSRRQPPPISDHFLMQQARVVAYDRVNCMLFYQLLITLNSSKDDEDNNDDGDVCIIQTEQKATKNIAKTVFQYHANIV